ncbi:MAG: alcohol dehydrogenase catalytic domain-containing protein, partial [Chloroflexota bacterium]
MKAGVLETIGQLVVKEVPAPQLAEGSVILRVEVCSICGTDLRIYRHGHARIKLPQILGHEIAGEIVAVADTVTNCRVGERVAITPRISCGECSYCRKGQPIYCQRSVSFGYQLPGGYAEYVSVPSRGVEFGVINRIADTLSYEEGALAETLACCSRAQKASLVGPGVTVVVVGGGPVGIIHCRLARASGADKVILVEREMERLEQVNLASIDEVIDSAKCNPEARISSLTGGKGADVVIVACSSAQAQEQSLSLAGRGGRVDFFGGLPVGQSKISMDSNLIHYQEISVRGSHGSTPQDNREALA